MMSNLSRPMKTSITHRISKYRIRVVIRRATTKACRVICRSSLEKIAVVATFSIILSVFNQLKDTKRMVPNEA